MRAIIIEGVGGPEVLSIEEVSTPKPGQDDVLVRVVASALNRADLLQRRGLYPAPPGSPQNIPGLEYAGEVVAHGDAVTKWRVGDRVMGIVGGGAGAEFVCVHQDEVLQIPERLSFLEAAAIPEAFLTGFDAAVLQGGLSAGQWLAVNAVGSGVGTALVQIARFIGAKVIGSSRTQTKLDLAHTLDLTEPVLGSSGELANAAIEVTEGRGVNVVIDLVGGGGLKDLVGALAPRGSLILVGLLGGGQAELPLAKMLTKRLRVQGTVLRNRSHDEKRELARIFCRDLITGFAGSSPSLRPVIDRVISWQDVAAGHAALERHATAGKIVLEHID